MNYILEQFSLHIFHLVLFRATKTDWTKKTCATYATVCFAIKPFIIYETIKLGIDLRKKHFC